MSDSKGTLKLQRIAQSPKQLFKYVDILVKAFLSFRTNTRLVEAVSPCEDMVGGDTVVTPNVTCMPSYDTSCNISYDTALPDELVEKILKLAWTSRIWINERARWHFYASMVRFCHQWRRIMLAVRYELVVLENLADLQAYNHFKEQYVSHSIGTVEEMDATYQLALIGSKSRMRISYPGVKCKTPDQNTTSVISIVRDMEIVMPPWRDFIGLGFVSSHWTAYTSLTSLSLFWPEHDDFQPSGFMHKTSDGPYLAPLPTVKSLQLTYPWRNSAVLESTKRILSCFPNLSELELYFPQPIFLKHIASQMPKLRELTLHVPPVYCGEMYIASIMGWNITSAVHNGLSELKDIFIITGSLEPLGWDEAVTICNSYNMMIHHVSSYNTNSRYTKPLRLPSYETKMIFIPDNTSTFLALPNSTILMF